METLRAAFIYPGYPPEESLGGGISTYAQEATEGLTRNNHNVTVFSRTDSLVEGLDPNLEIRVFRISSESQKAEKNSEFSFRNKGAQLYSERVREEIIKFEQAHGEFDVIEVGDWGAEAIALLSDYKHKLVIRCHTPSFVAESYNPLNPPYLSEYVKSLEKKVLQETLFIASPSQSLIDEIQSHVPLSADITIQPYPLKMNGLPYKREYQTNFDIQRPLQVVMSGRLEQRKGQDITTLAIQQLWQKGYNIDITFAGGDTPLSDGESFKDYVLRIVDPEFHNRMRFLGHIPRNQLERIYPQHDVYISASRFESLGFVVLEAMRAGLPVVASNVCEMPRLVQDNVTGYLFGNENSEELSYRIEDFYFNPNKIQEMGLNAREKLIDEYGDDKPIRQMIEYYRSIIE